MKKVNMVNSPVVGLPKTNKADAASSFKPAFGKDTELPSSRHIVGQDLVHTQKVKEIKPGSAILEKAAPIESKANPATFILATESGEVPDIWSSNGGTHSYKPGQIIMNYGEQPLDYVSNPTVIAEAKSKGLNTVTDRAVGDYDIMHDTYVRKDTGKYLRETPLKPGDPPIEVIKKAKGGVLVMPTGTEVHTLETLEAGKTPIKVAVGNVIMTDYKGNPYVGDVEKAFFKKNVPTSQESKQIFDLASEFIDARKKAVSELGENAKPVIESAWNKFVKLARKVI